MSSTLIVYVRDINSDIMCKTLVYTFASKIVELLLTSPDMTESPFRYTCTMHTIQMKIIVLTHQIYPVVVYFDKITGASVDPDTLSIL